MLSRLRAIVRIICGHGVIFRAKVCGYETGVVSLTAHNTNELYIMESSIYERLTEAV